MTWLAQLLLVPLLLTRLGRDAYGLYAVLTSVVGYFGLLTFGASLTVPRYVADHAARNEAAALSRFVSTYAVLHLAIAATGIVLGIAATPVLHALLRIPPSLVPVLNPAWDYVLLAWGFGLLSGLFQSLLTGIGDVHLANLANAGRTVLNLGIAAMVLLTGGGLAGLLGGLWYGSIIAAAALFGLVRSRRTDIAITPRLAGVATLRATLGPASYYFLMQVAALVVMGTDNVVIAAFLGVSAVAAYAVAFQLWNMTLTALWTAVDPLLPFFTRWDAQGDSAAVRSAYLAAAKWAAIGSAVAAVVIAGFGREIVSVWTAHTVDADPRVLLVFGGTMLIASPIHVAALALAALGKHKPAAIGGGIEAVLNLGLSLALVRTLGTVGVALGTLLAGCAANAWIAPLAANRAIGIRHADYVRAVLLPAALALIATGTAVLLARSLA